MNERFNPQETAPDLEINIDSKKLLKIMGLYRSALESYETTDVVELSQREKDAQADLEDTFAVLSELRSITQNKQCLPSNWAKLNGQEQFDTKEFATLKQENSEWKIKDIVLKDPFTFAQHFDLIVQTPAEIRSAQIKNLRQSRMADRGPRSVYKPNTEATSAKSTPAQNDELRERLQNAKLGNTKKGWWR